MTTLTQLHHIYKVNDWLTKKEIYIQFRKHRYVCVYVVKYAIPMSSRTVSIVQNLSNILQPHARTGFFFGANKIG